MLNYAKMLEQTNEKKEISILQRVEDELNLLFFLAGCYSLEIKRPRDRSSRLAHLLMIWS